MRTFALRRISALRVAVIGAAIAGVITGALALLGAPFMLFFFAVLPKIAPHPGSGPQPAMPPAWLPLVFIIIYPLFGTLWGFISGFIGASAYNFLVPHVGAIEVEVEEIQRGSAPT